MFINQINNTYLIHTDEERIYLFKLNNISQSMSINGEMEFRGSSYNYKIYERQNKYIPITDEEIAELFIGNNETIEEAEK